MKSVRKQPRKRSTASIMSRELSVHEFNIRAPAFDEGVAIAGRFFFARHALLRQHAPENPPLTAVTPLAASFVRLVELPIRALPDRYRYVQATEFVAGFMAELLDEYEWRRPLDEVAGGDFPPSLLPTIASVNTMTAWASFDQESTWNARACQDGQDLVYTFLEVRRVGEKLRAELSEESRKAASDPLYCLYNCFIHALLHLVVSATHRYPRPLRYFLLTRLLGSFAAGLLALDCQPVDASEGSSGDGSTAPSRSERD